MDSLNDEIQTQLTQTSMDEAYQEAVSEIASSLKNLVLSQNQINNDVPLWPYLKTFLKLPQIQAVKNAEIRLILDEIQDN